VYENKDYLPRTFFVERVRYVKDRNQQMMSIFPNDLWKEAVIEGTGKDMEFGLANTSEIVSYEENKVVISTNNNNFAFLVFTDVYYPTWKAEIDGKPTRIYKTDYTFRGVFVPQGKHTIVFYNTLF